MYYFFDCEDWIYFWELTTFKFLSLTWIYLLFDEFSKESHIAGIMLIVCLILTKAVLLIEKEVHVF